MSTRALYTFLGEGSGSPHSFNVYKHHDGYPSGAARTIKTALGWFAWVLPRYESDEFAAAFCAAGKLGSWFENADELAAWAKEHGPGSNSRQWSGGGVRLMPPGDPTKVACTNCSDIQYRYEIFMRDDALQIRAISGNWWDQKPKEDVIFTGSFDDFYTWAMKAKDQAATA